jgi:hypothetical protein
MHGYEREFCKTLFFLSTLVAVRKPSENKPYYLIEEEREQKKRGFWIRAGSIVSLSKGNHLRSNFLLVARRMQK